ncbi:MAG: gamma-glutamyl-gamma-aminobutyrate hydrolase family protein [Alphaproteobacteria bacterium]|nr:gamma-glutamyl-gamma-aminobutyrate hydrolase family protein [Alphaproteobacteria bacterium]
MSAHSPLVGVSGCVRSINDFPFHAVHERYLTALRDGADCMPLIVPALGADEIPNLLSRLDGLLLTGSPSNVEPDHYDGPAFRPETLRDPQRDSTTLPLIRACIQAGIPVFAICRGHQELNVALGGSLHQHLHELPGRMDHRRDRSLPREQGYKPRHWVELVQGGLLERLTGERRVLVNSLHAQGIERLAPRLAVEAMAEDGTVEAVRVTDARGFALGVQWHPEALVADRNPVSLALFEAFGAACRARALGQARAA